MFGFGKLWGSLWSLSGCQGGEGGDWEAVLTDRAPNFVDPHDPRDVYPESLWQAFSQYIASIQEMEPEQYRLPASRYACAVELKERNLPFNRTRRASQTLWKQAPRSCH